ncbi:MAG: glycosyltransferase [Candidatus Bathyarchaeota archaeon]|nr:glycosyltransferase [Candidatus Bathyarchaeota archaeon]
MVEVTIGLCTRNNEETIRYVIKSLLSQEYPHRNIELIVVDGSSKDNTLKIIGHLLSKSNFLVKFFSENVGLGFARQTVVDNASSDYIIWVDGDTIFPKDFVRKQVEFMDKNLRVGIGRAKYGILNGLNYVAFLENIPFVVESLRVTKEAPLGICGTEGAIYRVKAIKSAGGFDVNIKGAGEDIDLARRILTLGWEARVTDTFFYEICQESWIGIWNQYVWWGYGGHYVFHKNKAFAFPFKMSPIGGFIAGISRVPFAFQLTKRKILCLLPFHYFFKRIAFCYGFTKAHIKGYGHLFIKNTRGI